MVEYTSQLDNIFAALADSTRRDIFERTNQAALTVNQIGFEYDMSIAAVSKHLKVLDEAGLINRRKDGRYMYISARPIGLREATVYLSEYETGEQNGQEE